MLPNLWMARKAAGALRHRFCEEDPRFAGVHEPPHHAMDHRGRICPIIMKGHLSILLLFTLCLPSLRAEPAIYAPPVPGREVATAKFEWHDTQRNRDVPAKVYFPKDGAG